MRAAGMLESCNGQEDRYNREEDVPSHFRARHVFRFFYGVADGGFEIK